MPNRNRQIGSEELAACVGIAYDDVTFVPTAGGTNLVPDPGFEDGDGWTDKIWSVYGNSTSHWRGDWGFGDPRSGTYSHVITNTAYGWLESDLFDVSAGETYNLSTYIRGRIDPDDSRDGWVWAVRVNWFDDSQVRIGYDHAAGGAPTTMPGTWTEVGDEVVAPVGAVEANIRIYLYMGSGWINIDDVTFDSPLVTETVYYSIGTETVGMRQHQDGDDELYWLLGDHLGSTSLSYKTDGSETLRQFYYPFGNLRGSTTPTVPTDQGFTGQTLDESTGLMHYNARYYDPLVGRFISADTIVPNPADPQQLNRYTYVTNNPIRYVDPSGHVGGAWLVDGGFNGSSTAGMLGAIVTMHEDGTLSSALTRYSDLRRLFTRTGVDDYSLAMSRTTLVLSLSAGDPEAPLDPWFEYLAPANSEFDAICASGQCSAQDFRDFYGYTVEETGLWDASQTNANLGRSPLSLSLDDVFYPDSGPSYETANEPGVLGSSCLVRPNTPAYDAYGQFREWHSSAFPPALGGTRPFGPDSFPRGFLPLPDRSLLDFGMPRPFFPR